MRIILAIIVAIFSLPQLGLGFYLLSCWLRIHLTDVYYVDYPYLATGLIFIGLGVLSCLATVYGVRRRGLYGLLFVIPVMIGLWTMVYLPDGTPHIQRSMLNTNYLSSIASFSRVWFEANHKFPGNESEFHQAMATDPAAGQNRVQSPFRLSPYSRAGERLPYEIVVVRDASGPRLENMSSRPGVIYYCVSSDQQSFWATMTALNQDVSRSASLNNVAGIPGRPWIIEANGKDYPLPENSAQTH